MFKGISDILMRYDLEGLRKMGAPNYEYEPEAERIIKEMYTVKLFGKEVTVEDLKVIVDSVFRENFGTLGYDKVVLGKIAEEIKELIK